MSPAAIYLAFELEVLEQLRDPVGRLPLELLVCPVHLTADVEVEPALRPRVRTELRLAALELGLYEVAFSFGTARSRRSFTIRSNTGVTTSIARSSDRGSCEGSGSSSPVSASVTFQAVISGATTCSL